MIPAYLRVVRGREAVNTICIWCHQRREGRRKGSPGLCTIFDFTRLVELAPASPVDDVAAVCDAATVGSAVESVFGSRLVAVRDETGRRVDAAHAGRGSTFEMATFEKASIYWGPMLAVHWEVRWCKNARPAE